VSLIIDLLPGSSVSNISAINGSSSGGDAEAHSSSQTPRPSHQRKAPGGATLYADDDNSNASLGNPGPELLM
jgi:hypothetical protein